ncbi:MAG: single-stranded-DNA-specific exonuclease RecJ, partial [Clostridia bacterium]|nr:single-stranded-DNA-specific exonuclease RecJ [Clostridia bacterium]
GVSAFLSEILVKRGITSARQAKDFLNPEIKDLYDPFLLGGMKEAVERITEAKERGERVVVYGDYDVDGITAVTVLVKCLEIFGINAFAVVPERKDGYGLSAGVYEQVLDEWTPDLMITVDCGIGAFSEVEELKDLGVDVIVTDHHEIPEVIPDCTVINCHLKGDYPFEWLCGAGVAYKLEHALIGEKADEYLDLVALATIADSMPLTDENRVIVSEGLKIIKSGRVKKSIKALIEAGGVKEITSSGLAFTVAPRINAAGRMGDAYSALSLFLSEDPTEIKKLAGKLNSYNYQRQELCDLLYKSAKLKLQEKDASLKAIVLADDNWQTGLIGIVAAKLAEEYRKPVILFCEKDRVLHGSARSSQNINVFSAINAVKDLTLSFGGHAQAAGVTIEKQNIVAFEKALDAYLSDNYDLTDFSRYIEADMIIKDVFPLSLAKEVAKLEPFGVGNRPPCFAITLGAAGASPLKYGSPHVEFKTEQINLIYFNGYEKLPLLNSSVTKCALFEPNVSVFNGKESLKGYIRAIETVAEDGDGQRAALLDSQISKLNLPQGKFTEISTEKAQEMIISAQKEVYGTLFVINDARNLSAYKGLEKLEKYVFSSPYAGSVDALYFGLKGMPDEGYKRIVYLDKPLNVEKTAGAEIFVNTELCGVDLRGVSPDRNIFGEIYKTIKNGKFKAGAATEIASSDDFGFSPSEVVFALRVFSELKLIKAENGFVAVDTGVRAELQNSKIYNTLLNYF